MMAPTQGATNKTAAIVSDLGQMLNQELKLVLSKNGSTWPLLQSQRACGYHKAGFL